MRWDEQLTVEAASKRLPGFAEPIVRTFDAPETLDTRFHEIYARSAINRVPGASRVPFSWTINPYRGCTHACTYCFARPTHEYLDWDAGRDFEREIVVKVNVPEVLRAELAKPSWCREHVALGTNTDPYQWVEKRYGLMRGIWEAFRDFRNPCSVLTKSPLLLRDVDLFKELLEVTEFRACLSIPTLDEKAWRATEPHTPHPRKRIEAVAELNRQGIPASVLIAPLMPGINDSEEQVQTLMDACREAGARTIGGQALFLRGSTKDVFMDWLRTARPDLVARYEKLYAGRSRLAKTDRDATEAALRRGRRPRDRAASPRFESQVERQEAPAAARATERPAPREVQAKLF